MTPNPEGTPTVPPRRILVVDDNEDGVAMLSALLTFDGHEVATASSGLEAVASAVSLKPDVVLLDLGLPGIDGYEVARRIRAAVGDASRLIAITGYSRDEDRERTTAAGFSAHLVKPVDFDSLRRALAGP